MSKLWSLLFAVVMLACLVLFIVSPMVGWWLPLQASHHAHNIDFLFYVILWITGFFFVLTEALLCWFMFRYAVEPGQRRTIVPAAPGSLFMKAKEVIRDEHRLEMLWTIVPAVILLYIAFAQIGAWAEAKYQARMPQFTESGQEKSPVQMEVTARQWEWRVRYPSPHTFDSWKTHSKEAIAWGRRPQFDDIHLVNEIHTWKDQPTLVQLKTADVIHSFFLPQMRVKQDALPGKVIPVWFTPKLYNTKRLEEHTASNQEPPDHKHQWSLRDGKKTDKGFVWVAWVDGYDPEHDKLDPKGPMIWELSCAELCGAFHYRMIGHVYVHKDEADFKLWLQTAYQRQNDYGTSSTPSVAAHK